MDLESLDTEGTEANEATEVENNLPDAPATDESTGNLEENEGGVSNSQPDNPTYKVPFNGQDYDLSTDELLDIAKEYADKRSNILDNERKLEAYSGILSNLKENPWGVLEKLGFNPQELSQSYIHEQEQLANMSESERQSWDLQQKHAEMQAELEDYRSREQETLEQQQEREEQEQITQEEELISNAVAEALENNPNLPNTPETGWRMAQFMHILNEQGHDVDPADLVPKVLESYNDEFKSVTGNMSGEQLADFLGDDALKKLRDWDVSRVRSSQDEPTASTPNIALSSEPENKKWNLDDL